MIKKDVVAIGLSLVLIGVSASFISAPNKASSQVQFSPPEIALGYHSATAKPLKKREVRVSRSSIRISPIEKPNKKRFVKSKPKRSKKKVSRSSEREVSPTGRNQRIGHRLAAEHGWTGGQWNCLRKLWIKESGWSATSDNPTSSAYGIPQILGLEKRTGADPEKQVLAGISYIDHRYGSPCKAWSFWQSHRWY